MFEHGRRRSSVGIRGSFCHVSLAHLRRLWRSIHPDHRGYRGWLIELKKESNEEYLIRLSSVFAFPNRTFYFLREMARASRTLSSRGEQLMAKRASDNLSLQELESSSL